MRKTRVLTQGALIAALYVVLTYITNLIGLANGAIQVRFSEALTILPAFSFSAVPGLTGAAIWDIVFGSFATLLGALGTYYFGRKKYLAPIYPIAANTLIIPFVLKLAYGVNDAYGFLFVTIFAGEFISCGVLGVLLYSAINKSKIFK